MADKTKKPKTSKKQEALYPEQLNIIYSNSAFLLMTERDLMIDFGLRRPELSKDGDFNNSPTEVNTRIIMSPQHAKVFSEKLRTIMEMYEKGLDKIPASPKKK